VADVVPLAAVLERHRDRRVAITFDDGYADNAGAALPALRAAGMPATVFVATDVLRGGELWWDRLEHLTLDATAPSGRLEIVVGRQPLTVDVRSPEGRARANRALSRRLRARPPAEITAALADIAAQVEVEHAPCERHVMLTVDDVRTIAGDPLIDIDIGAHTRSHANLGVLDVDSQRDEIVGSRDDLARVLGHRPAAFAYPFGMRGSFDHRTEALVSEAGFVLACANVPGRVRARDRFRLPRHIVPDCSGDELANLVDAWLDGRTG
jgi:peptidoglycan/xylan/chitin deacetylase (PgdA/CDA1 family)